MEVNELMNRILFLVPNAKVSVWEKNADYHGEPNPVILSEMFVDWSITNGVPCPTQQEIDSVDLNTANQRAEVRRKLGRNLRLQNEIAVKAAFRIEKRRDPTLTFSDFLDQVEADSSP